MSKQADEMIAELDDANVVEFRPKNLNLITPQQLALLKVLWSKISKDRGIGLACHLIEASVPPGVYTAHPTALIGSLRAEHFESVYSAFLNVLAIAPEQAEEMVEERAAAAAKEAEHDLTGRPFIGVGPGLLPVAIDRVQRVLRSEARQFDNPPDRIFQRMGRLVRLNRNLLRPDSKNKQWDDEFREHNALMIVEVKPKWLANRLDRIITFTVPFGKAYKAVHCPPELCGRMIEDNTRWSFAPLFSMIETPTLRTDGTVLSKPGYDPKSGLFFDPGETVFPKVESAPSKRAGKEAMKSIENLLVDFPMFDAEGYEGVSLAVTLAAIMTSIVRRSLPTAPAFAVTGNMANIGKTELCELIGTVMTGRLLPTVPLPPTEHYREQLLSTLLRDGRQGILFDNVDGIEVGGNMLEQMVTQREAQGRVLTKPESFTVPTNALLLFNANNIIVVGAMTTRVLVTKLHTMQPLSERKFTYPNLAAHVLANRPAIVAAALTALRCYLTHGKPVERRGGESDRFPEWDALIAQALLFYGYADPARGGDEIKETDPVKEGQREVIELWWSTYGDATMTAKAILRCGEIRRAIAEAYEMREPEVNSKTAGRYFSGLVGVPLGLDITVHHSRTKMGGKYWLESARPKPAAAVSPDSHDPLFATSEDDLCS